MKKIILLVLIIICAVAGIIFFGGLYPVAVVDGDMISYRVFKKAEKAGENFANAEFQKTGMHVVDFTSSENTALLHDVQKGVMTFLIENSIIKKEGSIIAPRLDTRVRERVDTVLQKSNNSLDVAQRIYGLSPADFRTLVLESQAWRDIVAEALRANNQDFFTWLSERKKKVSVRLFFMGFQWDGEKAE